jgi:diguanylate cyclase (GGDEF)-like protein
MTFAPATLIPAQGGADSPAQRPLGAAVVAAALTEGRVVPFFQPIVALPARTIVAFEALARLSLPDGTVVGPERFIATAERTGTIRRLGAVMLDAALAAAVSWRSSVDGSRHNWGVGVNVAPAQLEDPAFHDTVGEALRRHGLPPAVLTLEITETTATSPKALPALERLSSLGVKLALDDFGMGFANLDQLRRLPVHALKIDRSFVAGVTQRGPDQAIVRMVIDLADALGLTVIAEGVETEAQIEVLDRLGCRQVQGFHFSPPVASPDEAAARVVPAARPAQWESAAAAWSPEVEASVLAAARLLAGAEDRARAALHTLAASAARGLDLRPEVVHATGRLALVHDLHRLAVDGRPPDPFAAVPVLANLAAGRTPTDPYGSAAAPLLTLLHSVVRDASGVDPALPPDVLAAAVARAAGRPDLDVRLAQVLRALSQAPPEVMSIGDVLDDLALRRAGRRGMEDRLLGLVGVSRIVSTATDPRQVLRLALEEARRITGAATAALDRWDPETGRLTTVVNVGGLAPGETTFPSGEVYDLSGSDAFRGLLTGGVPNITSVSDATGHPGEIDLLADLGLGSSAIVPVLVDGRVWGIAWFATGLGEPEFTPADAPLLEAVGVQVSAVVTQAETVDRMARLAFQDPLTRLANRRALDDTLEALRVTGRRVAVAVIDVDGLKAVNDAEGHERGDEVLCGVAEALTSAAGETPGAMVARMGGDEFCVVLPDAGRRNADWVLRRAEREARRLTGVGFTWGLAVGSAEWTIRGLMSTADREMYAGKRRRSRYASG